MTSPLYVHRDDLIAAKWAIRDLQREYDALRQKHDALVIARRNDRAFIRRYKTAWAAQVKRSNKKSAELTALKKYASSIGMSLAAFKRHFTMMQKESKKCEA